MNQSIKLIKMKTPKLQSGAALMELMVGITIGLLVVVAAVGSLVYTRTASTTTVDSTRLQQKADGFFRLIKFQLPQAGGIELAPLNASVPGTPDPDFRVNFSQLYQGYYDTTATGTNGVITSVHGSEGVGTASDTLRISTQDDQSSTVAASLLRDCTGARPPAALVGVSINNQYTLAGNTLTCTVPVVGGTNPQPILDGVEDFQVMYGLLTAGNNYQYYTANTVPSWPAVNTVTICLRMRGDVAGNPQNAAATVPGCFGAPAVANNDGIIRRVYTRTFSLRNALS